MQISGEVFSVAGCWQGHLATVSSPLPAVLTCLNINNEGGDGNVSIKHQECQSREMDCFQNTMQAVAYPVFCSWLLNPLNINPC